MLQRKKITSPPDEWRNIPFSSKFFYDIAREGSWQNVSRSAFLLSWTSPVPILFFSRVTISRAGLYDIFLSSTLQYLYIYFSYSLYFPVGY